MQLFVYDENPGRDWQLMLGQHRLLQFAGNNLVGRTPVPCDVVVCHRVQRPEPNALLDSLATSGVIVVDVGGNPALHAPAKGNRYRRAKAVSAHDLHFQACFNFFRRNLESTGKPDWRLLEGPPPPDALFAYHLLSLLPDDRVAAEARDELGKAAMLEVKAITDATPGLKALETIDDREQRVAFLRSSS